MKVKSKLKIFDKDPPNVRLAHYLLYDKYPVIRIRTPFGYKHCTFRDTIFELQDYSARNIIMKLTKKMYYEG